MAAGKATDEPKIKVFAPGTGGVQLVKNSLQLSDEEVTQAQNAEMRFDSTNGGEGSVSKRGGIQALTSVLAGSVLGMVSLPLPTTYTKTLYAPLQTEDGDRHFLRSTDGTTWVATDGPLLHFPFYSSGGVGGYAAETGELHTFHRMASYKDRIYYPGDYVHGTDSPALVSWDGDDAIEIVRIPRGPSGTDVALRISDMLVANSRIYLAIRDSGGTSPNQNGRVLAFDPRTGVLQQVANPFGAGTGQIGNGWPHSLCWYQGQLWTTPARGGSNFGAVYRCYPDTDTEWTADVTNVSTGKFNSMAEFQGELYLGASGSSEGHKSSVWVRSSQTGAYTESYEGAGTGGSHTTGLIVYDGALYAIEHVDSATDIVHVKKFDGSSWTTDLDIDSLESFGTNPPRPGGAFVFNGALYVIIRSSALDVADGVMYRKSGGSWTKVATDNFTGPITLLVERD